MRYWIDANDFMLLSSERQSNFTPPIGFETSVEGTRNKVCQYIREIFSWGSLSDLANENEIDIEIIVFLSNYANTYKELRHHMSSLDPRIKRLMNFKPQEFIKVIENEEDFSLQILPTILDEFIAEREQTEYESRAKQERERREILETWYKVLLEYLELQDTPENRELIHKSWIHQWAACWSKIVEYFKEKGIKSLDDQSEWNNGLNFLAWWGEEDKINIGFETIAFYSGVTWIKATEPVIEISWKTEHSEPDNTFSWRRIREATRWFR